MLWDLMQQMRIHRLAGEARHAHQEVSDTKDDLRRLVNRIDELERSNESLTLACTALWEIMRDRVDISDADLEAKMGEIDLRDGVRDGRATSRATGPMKCPECGRPNRRGRTTCIYCGRTLEAASPF